MLNLTEITSHKNCQIKTLRKLAQKKHRRQYGKFTVENLTIIVDALKSGVDFLECFVTQVMVDKHQEQLLWLQENSGVETFFLIDDALNASYSQLDTSSGITAIYEIKQNDLKPNTSALYLNGIKDPGNMGTILRSALAFGVENIVCDATCVDIYNFKTIHAAKDAIFKVSVAIDVDGRWINEQKGVRPIYVANSHNGESLETFKAAANYCLVCGSESHGVSEEILNLADVSLHIKISDKIESLNVATATAILLYGLK